MHFKVIKYKKNILVLKDITRRTFFNKKELFLIALKSVVKNQKLQINLKKWLLILFLKLNRLIFISRIKNFCIFTSKSKGVFNKLGGISRMTARNFLNNGSFFYYQRL